MQYRKSNGDMDTVDLADFSQIGMDEMLDQCNADNGGDIAAYARESSESLAALPWGNVCEWDDEEDKAIFFDAVEECIINELTRYRDSLNS